MPGNQVQRRPIPPATAPYGPVLAPYACDPARSRGRLHPEPESAYRSAFLDLIAEQCATLGRGNGS